MFNTLALDTLDVQRVLIILRSGNCVFWSFRAGMCLFVCLRSSVVWPRCFAFYVINSITGR
jgi:hypothetical protein